MTPSHLARIVAFVALLLALVFLVIGGPWVACLVVAAVAALVSVLLGSRTL